MRSFFVQIYLAFWMSTIAIFIAASLAFPRGDVFRPDNVLNSLELLVRQVAEAQLEKTPAATCEDSRQLPLLLFGPGGQEICGKTVAPEIAQTVARARSTKTRQEPYSELHGRSPSALAARDRVILSWYCWRP